MEKDISITTMRERVQCIILQDNKILFVKDVHAAHYYPPGGSIDEGESHTDAIARELMEELGIAVETSSYYFSYEEMNVVHKVPQREHNYFVSISGTPQPDNEVEDYRWVSWEDIEKESLILPPDTAHLLMSRLHGDGHLI